MNSRDDSPGGRFRVKLESLTQSLRELESSLSSGKAETDENEEVRRPSDSGRESPKSWNPAGLPLADSAERPEGGPEGFAGAGREARGGRKGHGKGFGSGAAKDKADRVRNPLYSRKAVRGRERPSRLSDRLASFSRRAIDSSLRGFVEAEGSHGSQSPVGSSLEPAAVSDFGTSFSEISGELEQHWATAVEESSCTAFLTRTDLQSDLAQSDLAQSDSAPQLGSLVMTDTVPLSDSSALESSMLDSVLEPVRSPEDFWRSLLSARFPESALGERYLLQDPIWVGYMSRVFRAVDRAKRRPVAVKVLPPGAGEVQRRSLEAVLTLDHPNILQVEDFGEVGEDGLFLVTPLLEGTSLREVLASARRPAVEALLLAFRRVCIGMAYAHERSVVHGDLKPANVQIEPDGQTTVIDWGIACRSGERLGADGKILGTPLYMAPEQVEGDALTPQTDVFSLGTLLYEILTGVHPAGPADDLPGVIRRVQSLTPPPPSHFRESVDPALDDLVMRCLRKDRAERFPDAGAVLEELEGCTLSL